MPSNPKSTASIAGHPIHPMLIPFPIAFFVTTLVCDLVFWRTGLPIWATAATWLVGAGVVMALVAAVFGLIDFLGEPRIRDLPPAWWHFIGNLIAVGVAAINWYYHATFGVLPWGIVLSLVVALILLVTGWKGWEMVYRGRVGVSDLP
jgi:uncharacterized membrane protein